MDLCPLFEWIDRTALSAAMHNSHVFRPIAETIHLLGISLAIGTIVVVDLSLLGAAMRRDAALRIAGQLAPFTRAGFAVIFASGALLFWSDALRLHDKPLFWIKMALLLVAVLYRATVYRRTLQPGQPLSSWSARLAAAASLALWVGVGFVGKGIGLL